MTADHFAQCILAAEHEILQNNSCLESTLPFTTEPVRPWEFTTASVLIDTRSHSQPLALNPISTRAISAETGRQEAESRSACYT